MAKKERIDIEINAGGGEKTIGDLQREFSQLKEQIKQTKAGSKEYFDLLKKIGEVKGDLKDLREGIAALDPGDKAKAFGSVVQGLAGGFEAATGALALFGVESKDVQQTMIKLQAAANLASGIQSVSELGKHFNILKTIILSNPLMTIATVIAGIGVALVALRDKIEVVGKAFEFIGGILSKIKDVVVDVADAVGIYDKKAAQLEDTLKTLAAAEKGLTDEIDRQIKLRKAEGKDTFDIEKQKLEIVKQNALAQIQVLEQLQQQKGQLTDEEKQRLDELKKKVADTNVDIQVLETQHNQEIQKKRQEQYQKWKELQQKKEEEQKQKLKDEEELLIKSYEKQLATIDFNEKEALKIAQVTGEDEYKIKKQALEAKLSLIEQEIQALQERKNKGLLINQEELEQLKQQQISLNNDLLVLEEQKDAEIKAREQKLLNDLAELRKKDEEEQRKKKKREEQLEEQIAAAKQQIAQNSFQAVSGLSNLLFTIMSNNAGKDAQRQRELAKRKFEIDKILNAGQATMNTYNAITKTLASVPAPLNVPAAIAVGAMGFIQVANILAQKFNDTGAAAVGGGGASVSAPTTTAATTPTETPTQTPTPLTPTGTRIEQNAQGDVQEGMIVRAYVVERDITDSQKKREVIQQLSGV